MFSACPKSTKDERSEVSKAKNEGEIMRAVAVITTLLFLATSLFAERPSNQERRPAQTGALASKQVVPRIGYIDRHGTVVIQPMFQEAEPFAEGLAAVRSGERWGYIDKAGNWSVKPRFTRAKSFSEGLAAVNIHGAWGFVNMKGTAVIPPRFDDANSFSNARALVEINNRWEYVNRSGKLAFKQTFSRAQPFSEGLAAVCSDQVPQSAMRKRSFWMETGCAWGFINPSGQFVIKPHFNSARNFSEGLAGVQVGLKWGYVDKTGKMVIKPQFDEAGPFIDGLANVSAGGISGAWFLQEGRAFVRCGYINRRGRWAFSSRLLYYYRGSFSGGVAQVEGNFPHFDKTGYVDKTGKIVIKPQYEFAGDFSDGLAAVWTKDGCGYINHAGSIVLRLKSGCGSFSEGLTPYGMGAPISPVVDRKAESRWIEKGRRLLAQHRESDAIDAFSEAASYHGGECPERDLGEAEAWAAWESYPMALWTCERFFAANPSDPALLARGHWLKGVCLVEEAKASDVNKLATAEKELRLASRMGTAPASVRYYLGLTLLKEGKDKEGIQELCYYIDQDPGGDRAEDAKRFIASPAIARENYAPSFVVTTVRGKRLTLQELRGKVVLLDFWASWCPPCRETLPKIATLAYEFPSDRFVLISVSDDQNRQVWQQFIRDHQMEWPQVFDPGDGLSRKFQVQGLPTLVLIDQQGVVRFKGWGWKTRRADSEIRALLNSNGGERFQTSNAGGELYLDQSAPLQSAD